jgi:uncharacterized membrane protein
MIKGVETWLPSLIIISVVRPSVTTFGHSSKFTVNVVVREALQWLSMLSPCVRPSAMLLLIGRLLLLR